MGDAGPALVGRKARRLSSRPKRGGRDRGRFGRLLVYQIAMTPLSSRLRSFGSELRRRRVFRAIVIYLVVAWIVIQVGEATFPSLDLPDWSLTLVIAMAALGFPIVLVLAWAYDLEPAAEQKIVRTPEREPQETEVTTAPPENGRDARQEIESIAVLPFADMSPEGDQEYFGDGLAEELLNTLTRCCDYLRVPARTSCFAFKGRDVDVREIGQTLGVDAVLEGSVRKDGEQLRITAQLIDVRNGYHLWSDSYDRRMHDVFAIQDEIANKVVDALDLSLSEQEQASICPTPAADVRAYEYYLRGRQLFHQITRRSIDAARAMFQRAIDIDPGYGRAQAGLADCYSYIYSFWDHRVEVLAHADAASRTALELDPNLAEAHVARGEALNLMGRPDEAASHFERALELNPTLFEAYYFYARSCFAHGDFEKAVELFDKAHRVRPEDYQSVVLLAIVLRNLERVQEADEVDRRSIELIEEHLKLNPDDARAYYMGASCWVSVFRPDKAREWIGRSLEIDSDDAVVRYGVGCNYARLGDVDDALDNLERAIELGFGYREWIANDSDWLELRGHPRFLAVLAELAEPQEA